MKFIELRFIEKKKDMKPLKYFARDMVFVFVSSLITGFIFFNANRQISEFVNTITDAKVIPDGPSPVFTDAPGF
jgi:hypothetical protein